MAMTLRPTHEQDSALKDLATHWGISKQLAALRAIEESHARIHGVDEVETLGRRSLARWANVYETLANT